ncbi:MAG: CaiB/BaiF CoA-transferase family protein [Myxococcota bacterium]|nr:CaiB/BaiF CoA-transferase family protein [Myxococcota bacterium]
MSALKGLRVIDLTHMLSGPYCTMMLADLGAEVIKVEPPGRGEGTRRLLATDPKNSLHGMGAYFLTLNRNKQSITINLKSDEGRAVFYDLVKTADVVVNNFSVGVPERLGIAYRHLSEINPQIITASITGFGETGPGRERKAFDMVSQAIGGGLSITGQPEAAPARAGIPIGDLGGGVMAIIGVLSALVARQQTGRGQHVDVSMQDAQISLLNYMATMHFLSGEVPERIGNSHFVHVPYDAYECTDGYIIICVITDGFWKSVTEVLELPELDTEENTVQPGRWKNREQINGASRARLATNTQGYWLEKLEAERIPCAPVNDFEQALSDPQVLAREMVVEVDHPEGGSVQMPGNPVKLSHTPTTQYTPPPLLGQDTDETLRWLLKYSDADIERLRKEGAI